MPLGPVNSLTIITFDVVDVNIGNGFDTVTSCFNAPVAGTYYMNCAFRGQDSSVRINMNNDASILAMTATGAGNTIYY